MKNGSLFSYPLFVLSGVINNIIKLILNITAQSLVVYHGNEQYICYQEDISVSSS